MLHTDAMTACIYYAFAGVGARGPKRAEQVYVRWVQKLTTRECADESVVLCVALDGGGIRITIAPLAPPAANGQWAASSYGPGDADDVPRGGNHTAHLVFMPQVAAHEWD